MKELEDKKAIIVYSTISGIILYVFLFICSFNTDFVINKNIQATAVYTADTSDNAEYEMGELTQVMSVNGVIPDYDGNQSDYLSIYRDLIVGRYYIYNQYLFDFTVDGSFNGFFDVNNQNVSGYLYEIVEIDNEPILHIINNERSAYVDYKIRLNKDKKIVLQFMNSESEFVLDRK